MPTLNDPVAITLGPFEVRWYAVFILGGIAAAILLIRWLAARRGLAPEFVLDMAPWVVFAAIAGARLYYTLLQADHYAAHPLDAINLRLGGLSIHGALVAGTLTVYLYCRMRGQRFLTWIDLLVPGVALGQAIGRWGNWANQEAFGTPTDLSWAVTIDPSRRPAEYESIATFHPTFLYESIFNLANAVVLTWLALRLPRTSWLRTGDVAWLYFITYGVARLLIERIRTDSLTIGPLPAAYWLSFALIGAGAAMLILRRTIWTGPPEPALTRGG
ncbi:MAG: prolipoprotein diacylglyceryl transferase [Chloroflexia bacterium]|nr:prolipoprotein diacylglyceryl transferase [Chloroflexia bacterium]